jgi:hypothetical protein
LGLKGMVQMEFPEYSLLWRVGTEIRDFLLFLFHRTEYVVVFSSWKGLERNSENFLFCGTAGILSEIRMCSGYSVSAELFFV